MNKIQSILVLFCCFQLFSVVAQEEEDSNEKKDKFPSYFGFQVRPLLPTQFIGNPLTEIKQPVFTTSLSQTVGYSIGGNVRAGLSKRIALETGIHYNIRKFDVNMSILDSGIYAKNDLTFITFEIPVNLLVYIQMSKKVFASTALGVAMTFKPTDVGILTLPGGSSIFSHTGFAQRKFVLDFDAHFGVEYRTEKKGFYYIGGAAKIPFSPLFDLIATYKYQGNKTTYYGVVDGSFLAIEFKYFFHNTRNKGEQFKPGPIE
jgi:hypothetical protein